MDEEHQNEVFLDLSFIDFFKGSNILLCDVSNYFFIDEQD
jgi:hypothetical protein